MQSAQRVYEHRNSNLPPNQAQENLLRQDGVAVHEQPAHGGRDRSGNRKKWFNLREHAALWHCTDDFCLDVTLVEQQHGRDAHDIESTGNVAVVVNVQLCDGDSTRLLCGDFLENRRNLFAGPAPFGPEVNKNRCTRTIDCFVEGGACQRDDSGGHEGVLSLESTLLV